VDVVEYKGWKNNLRLSNGQIEVIITLDVGPRIISYRRAGGANVLKEYAEQLGKAGEEEWQIRGGHRLWTSPEDPAVTYAPDNSPVAYEELFGLASKGVPGGAGLTTTPDRTSGVQKKILLKLEPIGSRLHLAHIIINAGEKPLTLAPWALTVLAPGGLEIIPLPPKRPHPGAAKNAKSAEDFAPNQKMVLWPFFDFADPRWNFGSRFITLRQDAKRGPTKIGLAHRLDWVAYLNAGSLFVKRFGYEPGKSYPDGGCNFETFTNEDMLEMENLGPVVTLNPGEKTNLAEMWELHALDAELRGEEDVARHVVPLVEAPPR
jgi:hypothetical protein